MSHLEDSWYPYLLAYGLGPEVDRWFRAFGGIGQSHLRTSSFGSSGSQSTGFTCGGGTFGGAGASASWGAAISSIAGGVPTPGSSGSGGGGGGGGGGSGGGGGGGW